MRDAVLVYDDDCGFCTWWADYVDARSDVRLVGFSELDPDLMGRLPDDYEECSHLVTDERVHSCGESVEEALLRTDPVSVVRPAVDALRRLGVYRTLRERGYRRVADNRAFWGRLFSKTPPAKEGEDEGDEVE